MTRIDDCVFEVSQLIGGPTYTLEATTDGTDMSGDLSTIDYILIQQGLLSKFENYDPISIYSSDLDQDGVVSTYDLVKLRSIILGATVEDPIYHIVGPNSVTPADIDYLDIQIDLTTAEISDSDINSSGKVYVQVVQLGNLN